MYLRIWTYLRGTTLYSALSALSGKGQMFASKCKQLSNRSGTSRLEELSDFSAQIVDSSRVTLLSRVLTNYENLGKI